MTDMLQIIDLERHGLPMPRTLHELLDLVQATFSAQPGVNQQRDAQGQAPAPTGTGVMMGTVTMAGTGQPVEGVRVTLSGAELRSWIEREMDTPEPAPWAAAVAALALDVSAPAFEKLLEIVRGNLTTLADLPGELGILMGEAPVPEADAAAVLAAPQAREVAAVLADEMASLAEWNAAAIKSAIQGVGVRLGRKGRELFQPVRAALTGRTHGPELPVVAEALGRERCIRRLRDAARPGAESGTEAHE